jgi:16S rRNA processing protein RimM
MEMLAVGVLTTTHGLRGELTLRSYSGGVEHLRGLTRAELRRGGEARTMRVTAVRGNPPHAVVKFQGVDSPEQAQELRGFEIWVPREKAAPLAGGEFYAVDLCRCSLRAGGTTVGAVRAVVDAGATQMLEVEDARGRVFLVPFTGHFVGEVDVAGGTIELLEPGIVP